MPIYAALRSRDAAAAIDWLERAFGFGYGHLVIFGPIKAASMARDLGRFVNGANRTVEGFKEEILSEEETEEVG